MKNNKQAQIALRLVHTYVVRIEKSQLNIVVEEKKSQETKPKENLEAVSSRSQFKRVWLHYICMLCILLLFYDFFVRNSLKI